MYILIIIFGIYTRCVNYNIWHLHPLLSGPGLGLIMHIFTTLEFPTHNSDFHDFIY